MKVFRTSDMELVKYVCLSVPRQISKTKQDRYEISSPL